jgi:integrase
MKGHLRERPVGSGNWSIVLDVGERDPRTGKKKRKWHSFRGTKREAQRECARLVTEIDEGKYIEPSKMTVADYFEKWLKHVRPQVSPKSHERYCELLRKNLEPLIGTKTLSKLRTADIDEAFSTALESGRRDGTGGLAPRTVHHIRRVAHKAFAQAVVWDLMIKNPVAATTAPKVERKSMTAYDGSQLSTMLAALRPTRMYIPAMLASMCGLRRGEIAALRWKNVQLGDNLRQVSIVESAEQTDEGVRYKEPKSGRARVVALSKTVIAELRAHRARQAEEQLRLGIRVDGDSFVVAQVDGSPLQPRSMTHEWVRIIGKTTLPRIRFHDLRHTHATQLLASGVHPKVASERLGHSTIGITLDLYSHVMPGMQADAAEQVDGALRSAILGAAETK